MATNRRRSEEPRPNLIEEMLNVQRGLFLAGIEGMGALADMTQDFVTGAVQRQPFSASRTVGDVIRETPETLNAALPTPSEVINFPRRMVDTFYREYQGTPGQRPSAGGSGDYRGETASPENTIVLSARAYLESIPQGGALVTSVVNHIALTTGYPPDIIRTIVLRNFVSNGVVVRNVAAENSTEGRNPIVLRMQQALAELGYNDVRADCPLLGLPGSQEKAALVAFDSGGNPLVLCYPAEQSANSPQEREAARFQAATIVPDKVARLLWVSDGVSNYYLDIESDMAIAALPPYAAPGGKTKP